jgi:hypothetical protein
MVTGGVAYVKLNQLAATSADLVVRADRGDKAAEIQTDILYQVQAEKNLIIASNDADIAKFAAEIKKQRENALRLTTRCGRTTEAGKVLLGKFSVAYREDECDRRQRRQIRRAQFRQSRVNSGAAKASRRPRASTTRSTPPSPPSTARRPPWRPDGRCSRCRPSESTARAR